MVEIVEKIKKIEPKMIKRAVPGWLAVSPDDASLRVGVTGPTESDARQKFFQRLKRWEEIDSQNAADQ